MSKQDRTAALALHNKARLEANGAPRPPLTWDDSLASDAESYALQMALKGRFEHAKQSDQGENLAWCSGPYTYLESSQAWLDEKPLYSGEAITGDDDAEGSKKANEYGHYTQMIWPEATRVGMGMFCCPAGDEDFKGNGTYVVARYNQVQQVGQTAWRPSRSNQFAGRGGTGRAWKEEEWIRKYGPGYSLCYER